MVYKTNYRYSRSKVLQNDPRVFKTNYRLMQVKSIAECPKGEHSAILLTIFKLPLVIDFVLSIYEWLLKTGFTVPPAKQPSLLRERV